MSISRYFEDLSKAYRAELEDLQTDSEGKNVLSVRLNQKRAQFASLMPMIEFAPEMVAPVFHEAITFLDPHAIMRLTFAEPEEFIPWDEVRAAVRFAGWSQKFVDLALQEEGGEQFLTSVICLEFLHERNSDRASVLEDTGNHDGENDVEEDGDGERQNAEADDEDLEEAGADWLAEQGFDRRG